MDIRTQFMNQMGYNENTPGQQQAADRFMQLYALTKADASPIVEAEKPGDLSTRFSMGVDQVQASLYGMAGDKEGYARNLQEALNQVQNLNPEMQQKLADLTGAKTFEEAAVALLKNPDTLLPIIVGSAPTMGVQLAAGAVGGAAGALAGPAGATAGTTAATAASSYALNYQAAVADLLGELGWEPSVENVKRLTEDPDIAPYVEEYARNYAAPVAAFDALSFGLAGKFIPKGVVAGGLTETGKQAAGAAFGEAGGQQLSSGKITSPGEVLAEGVAEVATAAPEMVVNKLTGSTEKGEAPAAKPLSEQRGRPSDAALLNENPLVEEEITNTNSPLFNMLASTQTKVKPVVPENISESGKQKIKKQEGLVLGQAQEPSTDTTVLPKQVQPAPVDVRIKRLMSNYKKAELDKLANDAKVAIPEKPTKKNLAEAIANNYAAVSDEALGIKFDAPKEAQPVAVKPFTPETVTPQQTSGFTLPAQMATLTVPEKQALTQASQNPSVPPVQRKAATRWLSSLPERVTKVKQVNRALNLPETTAMDPVLYEKLNKAHSKKDAGRFVSALIQADPLKSLDNNTIQEQLVSNAIARQKTPEAKEALKETLKTPTSRRTLVASEFEKYLALKAKGKTAKLPPAVNKAFQKLEKAYNEFGAVPEITTVPDATPQQNQQEITAEAIQNYQELYRLRNPVLSAFTRRAVFEVNPKDEGRYSNLHLFGRIMNSFDWIRTMDQVVRNHKQLIPYYSLSNLKTQMRQALTQRVTEDMSEMVTRFGETRARKALEIADEMSRPGQPNGPQKITFKSDGRLIYRNKDNKMIAVDKETTEAFKVAQLLYKKPYEDMMQIAMKGMERYGFDPLTVTYPQVETFYNNMLKSNGLGKGELDTIQSILDTVRQAAQITQRDTAYFPHERSESSYGITYYKKGKDGKNELAFFASVPTDDNNRIIPEALEEVQKRAREDMERVGETWTSFDGGVIGSALPFYKTKNTLMSNLGSRQSFKEEALTQLLTSRGVDSKAIREAFKELNDRKQIETMFASLQEREGYFGYDNVDRIEVTGRHLMRMAHKLAGFTFDRDINQAKAAVDNYIATSPEGSKIAKTVDGYHEYINDPVDAAASIRQASFWYFLAGNPSTALLQLLNPFINTMSWVTMYVSPTQFASLQKDVLLNHGKILKNRNKLTELSDVQDYKELAKVLGIPEDEGKIISYLVNTGVIDPNFAAEQLEVDSLAQYRNRKTGKVTRLTPRPIVNAVKGAGSALGGMISVGEQVGRVNSALIVMKSLRTQQNREKAGKTLYENDPLFKANVDAVYGGDYTNKEMLTRFAIEENHGLFGKENRMPVARRLPGAFMFSFMQYPQSIMQLLARMLVDRGPEGKKAFFMMAVMYPLLFGGVMAVPGSETFDWLMKWYQRVTGDTDARGLALKLERTMKEMGLSENFSNTVTRGVIPNFNFNPQSWWNKDAQRIALDVDISQRIAPQTPIQGLLTSATDLLAPANPGGAPPALDWMGPVSSLIQSTKATQADYEAGKNMPYSVIKNYSPIFMRNWFKAADTAQGKMSTGMGKPLLDNPDDKAWGQTNVDDVLKDIVGVRSALRADVAKTRRVDDEEMSAVSDKSGFFSNRLANVLYEKRNTENPDEIERLENEERRIKQEWFRWNKSLKPGLQKNNKELMRAMIQGPKRRIESMEQPLKSKGKGQAEGTMERYFIPEALQDRFKER